MLLRATVTLPFQLYIYMGLELTLFYYLHVPVDPRRGGVATARGAQEGSLCRRAD